MTGWFWILERPTTKRAEEIVGVVNRMRNSKDPQALSSELGSRLVAWVPVGYQRSWVPLWVPNRAT